MKLGVYCYWVVSLTCVWCLSFAPLLAQEEEPEEIGNLAPVRTEKEFRFKGFEDLSWKTVQGRRFTYAKADLYEMIDRSYDTELIYRVGSQYCLYSPKYMYYDYSSIVVVSELIDRYRLMRIINKYLKPILGSHRRNTAYVYVCGDLSGRLVEVLSRLPKAQGVPEVPIEVYERMEAEILLSASRFKINPKWLAGSEWVELLVGTTDVMFEREREEKFYKDVPLMLNRRLFDKWQEQVMKDIIRYAHEFLGESATCRYFTPEIVSRILVDVSLPEYFLRDKFSYRYKEDKVANVLLPMKKRERFYAPTARAAYSTEAGLYQILFSPDAFHQLSQEEFAVQCLLRMCQVFVSYELLIDAYLDPEVERYLSEQDWFGGRLIPTLRYYADRRGLDPREMAKTWYDEFLQVLRPLRLGRPSVLEAALVRALDPLGAV